MTIPVERSRAVGWVRTAAYNVLSHYPKRGGNTAKVPVWKLEALHLALRHYPSDHDIACSHEKLPGVWGPIDGD